MELEKKLKIYAVISFLGLVLMTVAYVTPGWGVIEVVDQKRMTTPDGDEPVFMVKRDVGRHKRHHHKHHHHHHHDRNTLRIHMNLWYYVICSHHCEKETPTTNPPFRDGVLTEERKMMIEPERKDECQARTYFAENYPSMEYLGMWDKVIAIREIGKHACEFRVMASCGLLLGLLGFIFSLVYKRGMAQRRRSGLTAFICLLISGVLYLVCVGKLVTSMHQYKAMNPGLYTESLGEHLHLHCPWGIILAGLSGVFVLISATGHLCILSRDQSNNESRIYRLHSGTNQGKISKYNFTTIAPPGYDASVGLKVPLTSAMETAPDEAAPLPVKQNV